MRFLAARAAGGARSCRRRRGALRLGSGGVLLSSSFLLLLLLLLLQCHPALAQEAPGALNVVGASNPAAAAPAAALVAANASGAPAAVAAPQQTAPAAVPAPEQHQQLPYGHKPLAPVSPADGGLLAIVAVALFIASGAGVGGGAFHRAFCLSPPATCTAALRHPPRDFRSFLTSSSLRARAPPCTPHHIHTGVLVVPALLLVGGFGTIAAVALSNVAILASAVANMAFNVPRRLPRAAGAGAGSNAAAGAGKAVAQQQQGGQQQPGEEQQQQGEQQQQQQQRQPKGRPVIDWDLVMLFGPPTVVGSIAGSYVNMVIPSWVTKVTLFLLLVPMTWRMVDKARSLYKKETAAKRAAAAAAAAVGHAEQQQHNEKQHCEQQQQQGHHAADGGAAGGAAGVLLRQGTLSRLSAALGRVSQAGSLADEFGPDFGYVGADSDADTPAAAAAGDGGASALGSPARAPAGAAGHAFAGSAASSPQRRRAPLSTIFSATAAGAPPKPGLVAGGGDVESGGRAASTTTTGAVASTPALETAAAAGGSSKALAGRFWHHPRPPSDAAADANGGELGRAVAARIQKEERSLLPPLQVALLALILATVAATSIPGGFLVPCGTPAYWAAAVVTPLVVMLATWAVVRRHVLWKARWRAALGLAAPGDLRWTPRTTALYPAICISAGVIAGLLGLGGGLVLTPLMLELGVAPPVSAASTQVTLLVSSFASAVVYAVNDAVPWDYGAALAAVALLATLLGQWLVAWLVRRLGRGSVVVIVLAAMFSVSTGAALAVVIVTAVDLARRPEKLTLSKGVCPTFQ